MPARTVATLVLGLLTVAMLTLLVAPCAMAQDAGEAVGAAVGLGMMLVWLVVVVVSLGLWIWALVDCIQRTFPGDNEKIIWIVVIVLAGGLGAIIYLIVGRPKGTKA